MEERNEPIFVDSNYFIGLFNPQDPLSNNANRISRELEQKHAPIFISNFIFLEITTIISMRAGREIARETGKYLLSAPQIHTTHIDEALQQRTWDIFQEIAQKNISFVDCSIIAAMQELDIAKLLTFDTKDFKQLQKKYKFSLYE
jgi:predicted nucleic acid-binding protein